MNLLNKNKYRFKNEYRTNTKKYFDKPISKILFVNPYSVIDDRLNFTNFFQRKSCDRNNLIKETVLNCVNNPSFFNRYFEGEEISLETKRDRYKIKRLEMIIHLYDTVPAKETLLFKYSPNARFKREYNTPEHGLQFIFSHENNNLIVYLIDLYHLAIPSKKNKKGEFFSIKEEFEIRRKYKKGIEEIIFCEDMIKVK